MIFFGEAEGLFKTLLISKYSLYAGFILLLVNLIANGFQLSKIPFRLRYDLFAVGASLVWTAYWQDFFRSDTVIFHYYSLYFVLITAVFSLLFIKKRRDIDSDALIFLQWLSDAKRFNSNMVMILVIISLALPQYFMLFPVAITLLIVRFSLACCLHSG